MVRVKEEFRGGVSCDPFAWVFVAASRTAAYRCATDLERLSA